MQHRLRKRTAGGEGTFYQRIPNRKLGIFNIPNIKRWFVPFQSRFALLGRVFLCSSVTIIFASLLFSPEIQNVSTATRDLVYIREEK